MNAELRRSKALLLEQGLPLLVQLARGEKRQKLPPNAVEDRMNKIEELRGMIEDIPDGVHPGGARRPGRQFMGGGGAGGEITIDASKMDGRQTNADYYKHTEETAAFQNEWEQAKSRQDLQLESIEAGLGTLKEIGAAMNEELQVGAGAEAFSGAEGGGAQHS